jgi:hypothetical protein
VNELPDVPRSRAVAIGVVWILALLTVALWSPPGR